MLESGVVGYWMMERRLWGGSETRLWWHGCSVPGDRYEKVSVPLHGSHHVYEALGGGWAGLGCGGGWNAAMIEGVSAGRRWGGHRALYSDNREQNVYEMDV